MNITKQEIVKLAASELEKPSLQMTKQYLEIHQPVRENSELKIERVDLESDENIATVYLPVASEHFYLTVYIDLINKQILEVGTQAMISLFFYATSKTLNAKELQNYTTITATETWDKGDLRPHGKSNYEFSMFKIESSPEPNHFETKLKNFLEVLESDKEGIKRLAEETDGGINVVMSFHNGNGMLGGAFVDKEAIKRMAELGLWIDFDMYAEGNEFK